MINSTLKALSIVLICVFAFPTTYAQPSAAAPTPPARASADVISLYSDAYTNRTLGSGDSWSASWDAADVADVTVAGNNTKLYTNLNYAGIEFYNPTPNGSVNATNMTYFHIDLWSANATQFKIKLVDFGADGVYAGGNDVEHELTYNAPALSQWISYDIPLSSFTNMTTKGHISQLILSSSNSTTYMDNVYFYKPSSTAPTISITAPANNATYTASATIPITVSAAGVGGNTIDSVQYLSNGVRIGSSSTSPFSFSWTGVAAGTYAITAKAFDNLAQSTVSSAVNVTVNAATPSGYCGVGGPTGFTDYYWKATTASTTITWTFHPVGRAVNGTTCLLNNSLGNYTMTRNATTGDFTYSLDVGANSVVTFGFTYTLGTGTQVNTANTTHSYTKGASCIVYTTPTTAASNITFPVKGATTITVGCTAGDGSNRLIVMRAGSPVDFVPADGTAYTANTVFSAGTGLGTSATSKVVYNGTSNSVDVTGLTANTTYYVTIFEFNGTTTSTKYLTAGAPSANATTFAAAPATSITSPAAAASFYAPATIPITATATSGNSTIASVQYYANDGTTNSLIGTVTTGSSPYTYTWTNVPVGSYSLTTVATDALGSSTTSSAKAITVVVAPPANYCGSGGSNGATPDYYWKATTVSTTVTWTFHPVNRTVGGTTCTLNNSLGNYAMTRNATTGDFTYSLDVGGNTNITFGFTYTIGTGTQTSTSNTTHTYTKGASCIYYVTPSTPASNISFPAKGTTTMTISCTSGDGSDRLIVMRAGSAVDFTPVDGNAYTANALFTGGTGLGTSGTSKVVYSGTSNTVNVTGLTANTLYYVTVYEFNGVTTSTKYLTTGAPVGSTTTFASAPTVSLTSPTNGTSYFTASSIPFTATAATGTGTVASVQFFANNGTTNSLVGTGTLGSGTNTNGVYNYTWTGMSIGSYTLTAIATDNQGSATTSSSANITVSATPPAGYCGSGGPTGFTDYYWKASNAGNIVTWTFHPIGRAVNGTTCLLNNSLGNYTMVKNATTGDFTYSLDVGANSVITFGFTYTLGTGTQVNTANNTHTYTKGNNCIYFVTPSTAASNITFPAKGTTTMTINWTSGDGTDRLVVMRASSAVDFVPSDGTAYTANSVFSAGTAVGTACKVVYSGTGSTVDVTGLTANTLYYVTIYEFNGNTTYTKYLTTGAPVASTSTYASAPTVSLTSPANGTSYFTASSIPINATAASSTGTIASVQFYANNGTTNSLIGTVTSSPYNFTWTGMSVGSYTITARAIDNQGSATTSSPVSITVSATPPTNYCGSGGPTGFTDYYWKATNAGNIVTYTFHPVGRAIGGTSAIINNSLGNFTMVKQANGDFTFSHDVGGNTTITLAFTYTLGTTGNPQTSSASTHTYVKGNNCIYYVTPSTAATNITFPAKGSTTMTISCTPGDGSDRLIVMRAGSAVDFVPADGTSYTASSIFTSGTGLGTSGTSKVVYSGTGSTVDVTGLTANTLYYVTVYEFNGNTAYTKYLTTGAPVASTTTYLSSPTVSLTSPANGASYFTVENVPISATAASSTGTIASVQFYADNGTTNALINTATTSPYNYTWSGMTPGSYAITAKATDNQGSTTTSAVRNITVLATPPDGYCGSGGPTGFTDYYWKATNVGNTVTYTFHPVGRAVGGTGVIINNSLGNNVMAKQANGNYTYSEDVGANTTITLGFTYTLGTTGNPQTNTANNSHTYIKGNNCVYCPASTSAVLSGTTTICSGNTANLSVTITGGVSPFTVVYNNGSGNVTINNYVSGTSIPVTPTNTTTYTLVSVAGDCGTAGTGISGGATVTVNPTPVVSDKIAVTCSGTAFSVIPAGVPASTTYSWSAPAYAGTISGGSAQTGVTTIGQTLTNSDITSGTATYTITPTAGSCPGSDFMATITVNPVPSVANTTDTICSGSAFSVTPTGVPVGTTYTWTTPTYTGSITGGSAQATGQSSIGQILTNSSNTTIGTAKYVVTPKAGSCSGSTFTVTVTVNPKLIPSVTIPIKSGANPTCQGGSITFAARAVNVGATPSYQWYVDGAAQNGATDSVFTVSNVTTAYNPDVYVIVTVSGGSCVTQPTAQSSTTNISAQPNGWTGAISTAWSDGRNWCSGTVPTATSDVTIPVLSSGRYPVVSNAANVRNINIVSGAKVTLGDYFGSGPLTIYGQLSGAGTFSTGTSNAVAGASSNLVFTGIGNVGTLKLTAGSYSLNSLSLTGVGATLTLGDTIKIVSKLDIGSNTLSSGGYLTIKSDRYGTGSVSPVTGAGTISGNVTVERYIPANGFRAWRLLSVPTQTTQTFHQAWQENQAPMVVGTSGYGALITAPAGSAAGFDTVTAGASLLKFNQVTGGQGSFTGVSSTNVSMATNSGYFLFIRGDRSNKPTGAVVPPAPTTLRTKGPLYFGDQPSITVPANTNVLVGNVYASAIDFATMVRSNVNSFKVWDPKILGTYNLGGYQTFASSNGYDPVPGGGSYGSAANSRIESGQAFIVSSASGGSIQLTEAAKTTGSRNVFRTSGTITQFKTNLYAETENGAELADGNSVVFDNSYSAGTDESDVVKARNIGEDLAITSNGTAWVIEGRKNIGEADVIQYSMNNLKQQSYTLEFLPKNINTSIKGYLEDKFTGTKTPVSMTGATTVKFTVTADAASKAEDRFRIVFGKEGSIKPVVKVQEETEKFSVSPNPVTGSLLQLQLPTTITVKGKYSINVRNNAGQIVAQSVFQKTQDVAKKTMILPSELSAGVYQVELIDPSGVRSTQSVIIAR